MGRLGWSESTVYPLVLGGNTFGWTSGEADSCRVLDAFTEAGGNFVDTADVYSAWADGHSGGESETVLGGWLATRGRERVLVGTKVSEHPEFPGLSAANVKAAATASLRRLRADHIDVYYAHFDDQNTPLEETVRAFDALVREGKVRYVGVSNYSPERLQQWLDVAEEIGADLPVALQPHYNLVHRHAYEPRLRDIAARYNLAVLPYFALASGFLTGKYRTERDFAGADRQHMARRYFTTEGLAVLDVLRDIASAHATEMATVALAWLLTRPGVTGPIASASRPEQLPALLDAVHLRLSEEEARRLTEVSDVASA